MFLVFINLIQNIVFLLQHSFFFIYILVCYFWLLAIILTFSFKASIQLLLVFSYNLVFF